ncbi:MAG: hypothetical protein N2321_11015 [Melioribacteraceae bacterium]|nr:hypothetical protein [Melioribacteraceae bacterium]
MINVKKKLVFYLSLLAISLLLTNILIDLFTKKKSYPNSKELSRTEVENVFWKVLDDYGIKANWVTKKKFKQVDEDSVNYQFNVLLSEDIPIPLIIKDINNVIRKDISAYVSEEKKIFGETELRIYSNEYLKLKVNFYPTKNLFRDNKEISFLISDAMDLNEENYKSFLFSNLPINAVIVPDPALTQKADSLSKYSKEYVLLLNNDVDDTKMKLSQEFRTDILKKSIEAILGSFPKNKFVFVDENSNLFNSPIYNFVRDEFKKRNRTLFHMSECIKLNQAEDEMFSKLKFYLEDTITKKKIFYTDFSNFMKMNPMIEKFRKKGGKVLPVSKSYLKDKN